MTIAARDHIHLSATIGGAPENAPNQTFTVTERQPRDVAYFSVNRGLTGKLIVGGLSSAGTPIVFTDFDLRLKVSRSEYESLRAMHKRLVYFVDNLHPEDGADHTTSVKSVFVDDVQIVDTLKKADLDLFIVRVMLVDNYTVS